MNSGTAPILSGLSTTTAVAAINGAGFVLGTVTSVDNSGGATSANTGTATGLQSLTAGVIATLGLVISFSHYNFAPPVFYQLIYFASSGGIRNLWAW